MKLAEALSLRADLQTRLEQISNRLKNNVKVQDGDTPAEEPLKLFAELNETTSQLEDLYYRINMTNSTTMMADGENLTKKIARRDALTRKTNILHATLNTASELNNRYSRTEIKFVRTIEIAPLRKQCDDLSQLLRHLDIEIQQANWTVELI